MKKFLLLLFVITPFISPAQTDFKQVYDKSLEYQIKSSVGADEFWKFHPDWYYSIFHSKYKSGENENNNKIYLDSLTEATRESMFKVIEAKNDIEIIYQNELAHWNDRNNDWEISNVQRQLDEVRKSIGYVFEEFSNHKVSVDNAHKLYEELERIDNKKITLNKAHLDNAKRRQGYEGCLKEYVVLLNVGYRLLNMSFVASKYYEVTPEGNPDFYKQIDEKFKK
jgi:hypothetical protein